MLKSWWVDMSLLVVLFALLYLTLLGHRPLFVPDEGRYAEIAREMATSNDFITPTLNYIKYFEKPPLYYWMTALSIKTFGATISAVRLVNGLLSIFGCLILYLTARLLYDRLTALLSAGVLATSGLYFIMGHTVSLDLPLTVFLSTALFSLLLILSSDRIEKKYLFYSASFFAVLALLTKGLVAILFPALILLAYFILTQNFSLLKSRYFWFASIFFVVLALPWHILVSLKNPEFPYFYIVEQHFLRYSKIGIGHYQPSWFFIPWLLLGFFPWTIYLINAVIFHCKRVKSDHVSLFLLSWIIIIFAFFSFSKSKLIPYILPLFPALSFLIGSYLAKVKQLPLISFIFFGGFICIFPIVFYLYLQNTTLPNNNMASSILFCACSCLIISFFISIYFKRNKNMALLSLMVAGAAFWFSVFLATPAIDKRTVLPLSDTLLSIVTPQDEIINYQVYYQDLPFYLKRKITIVDWENELTFGMHHQAAPWMIKEAELRDKFNRSLAAHKIYIILRKSDYSAFSDKFKEHSFQVVSQTIDDILIVKSTI